MMRRRSSKTQLDVTASKTNRLALFNQQKNEWLKLIHIQFWLGIKFDANNRVFHCLFRSYLRLAHWIRILSLSLHD